jgi:hypothetical protein
MTLSGAFFPSETNPARFRFSRSTGSYAAPQGNAATVMAVTVAPASIVHLRLRTDRPAALARLFQRRLSSVGCANDRVKMMRALAWFRASFDLFN